nr:helix-turn-helix domain-containing protein [Eubacterium sp.]
MEHTYPKTGYLKNDFKLFYLTDTSSSDIQYHYHDFHKLLIFLRGNVSYSVEGRLYSLQPKDIVFVHAGEFHKPIIHDHSPYERLIIYISPNYFAVLSEMGYDLFSCFQKMQKQETNLLRFSENDTTKLSSITKELVSSLHSTQFAASLWQRTKFIEYLIQLNRLLLDNEDTLMTEISSHPIIRKILHYINEHLTEELTIDHIAEQIFLNRSYIMHLFKDETGSSIGKYITEKRLFLAKQYISAGDSVTDACFKSGFNNYSSFYHAYKTKYGSSPKTAASDILPAHIYPE